MQPKNTLRQQRFKRGVERRAAELMGEYQKKADTMDRLLGDEEGNGRMRRRLNEFGDFLTVVVGKYNELSDDGHFLLDAMAASRVDLVERQTGLHSLDSETEKGLHQGELRRQLATVNLRAGVGILLSRLLQCGEGGRLQNKQQEWMLREEERMARDREGQWAARIMGHARVRKGHIFRGD